MYISHMRNEGRPAARGDRRADRDRRKSGAPGRNLPFQAGRAAPIGASSTRPSPASRRRAPQGLRITADMYTYPAGATGLDAAMPLWVQAGGLEEWIERLKDPAIRARVIAEMRGPDGDWENLMLGAAGAGQGAADRLQERQAEAADRQDPGRGRARCAASRPRRPRSTWSSRTAAASAPSIS